MTPPPPPALAGDFGHHKAGLSDLWRGEKRQSGDLTNISLTGQTHWAGEAAGTSADTGRGWIVVYSTVVYSVVQWCTVVYSGVQSATVATHQSLQTVLSAVTSTTSHQTPPPPPPPPTNISGLSLNNTTITTGQQYLLITLLIENPDI